jgi:hypothetical protein
MRNALLVIAILGSILLTASETRAQCTCSERYVNITARDEFNLAYAVFVGKVVAIENTPRDRNDHYVETVTFQVTKAWKHDVNSNLTITNTIQGCVNGFKENGEWLVYAYKSQDGKLGSYCCCSRTRLLAKADDDVKTFADDPPARILRPQNSEP